VLDADVRHVLRVPRPRIVAPKNIREEGEESDTQARIFSRLDTLSVIVRDQQQQIQSLTEHRKALSDTVAHLEGRLERLIKAIGGLD
jgi:hypothetical protein